MKITLIFLCSFLFFSLVATCPPLKAQTGGNIHFGRLEIDPGIIIKEVYTDKVDMDDPKSGSDWITTFVPGVKLKWPYREHTIQGDWSVTVPRYAENTQWNYNEYRLSTNGSFLLGHGGNQIKLELGHLSLKSAEVPELGQPRRKREEEQYRSIIRFNFKDNLRFDLGYEWQKYIYEDASSNLDNRKEYRYLVDVNLKILPKTTTFLSTRFGRSNYENSPDDSSFITLAPGLIWDATAKLSGKLSVGFQWKDYEERDDINTYVIMIDLTHKISDFTTLTLGLDGGEREYSNTRYDKKKQDYIEYFNNYILNKIQLSYKHQITYKIGASLNFTFEFDDYQGIDREDLLYSIGFGLRYQPQEWLLGSLDIQQDHRTSEGGVDDKGTDYTGHIISLSIGFVL